MKSWTVCFVCVIATLASTTSVQAWRATYPTGPIRRPPLTASVSAPTHSGSGNTTLHFEHTPAWVTLGMQVRNTTTPETIPTNTRVTNKTDTSVELSRAIVGPGVQTGDVISFTSWVRAFALQRRSTAIPASDNDPSLGDLFRRRNVAYPAQEGATLGLGWDFLVNQKMSSTCVEFDPKDDTKYQTVDLKLQETTDQESLDISLNAEFSGSVGGTIEVVQAKAEATSTLNASHHIDSTDTVFTAHASMTSGVTYAAPAKQADKLTEIRLSPVMADLAKNDPPQFRQKCGDGFIASIGNGADLYILLHFHDMNQKDRLELSFQSKASAGMGDVFNAAGSSKLSTVIGTASQNSQLDLSLVQQGGIMKAVPIDLKTAQNKVQSLPDEEHNGPRPIFLTIVPYSELPNWPPLYMIDTSDPRQRAIRYSQRLTTLYYEIMNIREDYFRDRGGGGGGGGKSGPGSIGADKYFYSFRHQLRPEDLSPVADNVHSLLDTVDQILRFLNGPTCNPPPVPVNPPSLAKATAKAREELLLSHRTQVNRLFQSADQCDEKITELIDLTNDFDDFSWWIQLPLPVNTISDDSLQKLEDQTIAVASRKQLYAQQLFRHWVERPDQVRCRLFFECLSASEKTSLLNQIANSLTGTGAIDSGPSSVTWTRSVCFGEVTANCSNYDSNNNKPDKWYNCDQYHSFRPTPQDAAGKDICIMNDTGYRYGWTPTGNEGGNACGYLEGNITCYQYQPGFN